MAVKNKNIEETDYKKSVKASPPRMRRSVKPGTSRGFPKGKPDTPEEEKAALEAERNRKKYMMQARAYAERMRRRR